MIRNNSNKFSVDVGIPRKNGQNTASCAKHMMCSTWGDEYRPFLLGIPTSTEKLLLLFLIFRSEIIG